MNITLSSFKDKHGLAELLSTDIYKYWHTNDNLPHFIMISFERLTFVDTVELFLFFSLDESYTPEKIDIYTGLTRTNMIKKKSAIIVESNGWEKLQIDEEVFLIYVVIRNNHQDGRDSHVRGLKVMRDGRQLYCSHAEYYEQKDEVLDE